MKLKVKFLKWSAGVPVAMLSKETAVKIGIQDKERISLRTFSDNPKEISTPVNIADGLVGKNEIIVSSEIRKSMKLKTGQYVDINLTEVPRSLDFIKKKLDGKKLSQEEINEIILDIVHNNLSEAEISLFISGMYKNGMDLKEETCLINAILKSGDVFKLRNKIIADKHCTGGIPGNRTTPIVVSICASAGLIMPKTSSKAITSAAGTADVIGAIARVEFSVQELKKIIKKTNAFLVWGGSLEIVPADAKIIGIEKELKIDPESQLLASIISKKLAVGSNYILIDIPYGKNAKFTKKKAIGLKEKFERLGRYFEKNLKVVLTDGNQPIGNGIGPFLEMIDVMKVLDPKQESPKDLEKKSLFLSGELLEMTGKAEKGNGFKMAEEILNSGKALEKFKEIIEAQDGKIGRLILGKFKKEILSKKSGRILEINNKLINSLARTAGCPTDKKSGIYLDVHNGNKIKQGSKLLTIYSESKSRLKSAVKFYYSNNPIKII